VSFFPPLAACAGLGGEPIDRVEQSAVNTNAMNPNAMNPNAMNPNAMNPNAMNPNAMNPNAMDPAAMAALQDPGDAGSLSREFVRYAVSCAFTPDQSFDFSWTDDQGVEHDESYPGLLGLAPDWATGPLDDDGQQWVSACLASRVNARGVSVMLSSRGTNPGLAVSDTERTTYTTREGVFFGNVFASGQMVFTCYDPTVIVDAQWENRLCSQPVPLGLNGIGTFSCGSIQSLGPCSKVNLLGVLTILLGPCTTQNPQLRYLFNCRAGGTPYESITTFLNGVVPF
jgi:hypothetical protein